MTALHTPVGFFAPPGAKASRVTTPFRAQGTFPRRPGLAALRRGVVGALLFTGLAATGARGQDAPPESATAYRVPTDPGELLKVDEPMLRFFRERVPPRGPSGNQLRKLIDTILLPDGLHFTYDAEGTFDARETFRLRRGNCISFAFLVVAIAREYGFNASFQNVITPDRWDRYGQLVVSIGHMNVRVRTGDGTYHIDLRPDLVTGFNSRAQQVVGDERAAAQFYDTVGFFLLLHERPAEALELMDLATKTDPGCADAWANLAVMLGHLGRLADARTCFERSLRVDPRGELALEGYVTLLRRLGSPEDLQIAARFERRAQQIRDRNPYYQQSLAERAQARGDWGAAEKLLRRAIALKDDEPQFHEQRVEVLLQLGRADDARRATAKLEKLRRRLTADQVRHTP